MIKVSAAQTEQQATSEEDSSAAPKVSVEALNERLDAHKEKVGSAQKAARFKIQSGSSLKTLKILPAADELGSAETAPSGISEDVLQVSALSEQEAATPSVKAALSYNTGAAMATGVWLSFCGIFIGMGYGLDGLARMSAPDVGGMLSFVLAPVAFLWLIVSNYQRQSDVAQYTKLLRAELHTILFPEGEHPEKISQDVERLCRQASELSASSKAVHASISEAREGMREEIKGFMSLSKKTEFHIDRLAQHLNDKSETLLSMAEGIEDRVVRIDGQLAARIDKWSAAGDQMEARMAARLSEIREATDQADRTSAQIEKTLSGTTDTLQTASGEALSCLEDVSAGLESRQASLGRVIEEIGGEAARLGDDIDMHMGHMEDMSARILNNMNDTTDQLDHKKRALEEVSETLSQHAGALRETLGGISLDLSEKVEEATRRVKILEGGIGQTSETFEGSLDKLSDLVSRIESAGDVAASALGESLSLAVSGSDSLQHAVRNAVDHLEETLESSAKSAESLISRTAETFKSMQSDGEAEKVYLDQYLSVLGEEYGRLRTIRAGAKEELNELSEAIGRKSERLEDTLQKITHTSKVAEDTFGKPLVELEAILEGFDTRHDRIKTTLDTRISSLKGVGDRITETVSETSHVLKNQTQEISTLSGQISVHTQKINKEMRAQKDHLNSSVKEMLQGIYDVSGQLGESIQDVDSLSSKTENIINNINKNIKVNSQELAALSEGSVSTLRCFGDRINEELARFDVISRDLEVKTKDSCEKISQTVEAVAPDCDTVFVKMDELGARFKSLQGSVFESVEQNIGKLSGLGSEFDEYVLNLNEASSKATSHLRDVNNDLQVCVQDIENASSQASKKITLAQKDLRDQADTISLLGDQVSLKVSGLRESLEHQNNDLSEAVGAAVTRLHEASCEFGDTARMTADVSEEVVAKITEAVTHTELQSERLEKASAQSIKRTENFVKSVTHDSMTLLGQSAETIKNLDKARQSLSVKTKEIETQLESVLRMSGHYGEEMRKQAKLVAKTATDTTQDILKAGKALKSEVGSLSVSADDATLKITAAHRNIGEESKGFIQISSDILKQTEHAAQNISRQSGMLHKVSESVKASLVDVQRLMSEKERDAFFASARYLLESMYSMTVDLTRAMDGEISEKMWKAYQKGDSAIFMSRLQDIGKGVSLQKVSDKYQKDHEFRTYAGRYMKQFEGLYNEAAKDDRDTMLNRVIASSDVAKLYQILCQATEKKDITKKI